MIHLVDSEELNNLLKDSNHIVLVTDNFVGHRLDWLFEFSDEVAKCHKKLIVIALDASRLGEIDLNAFHDIIVCANFQSRIKIIEFLNQLKCTDLTFSFWDSDLWLKELLKLNHNSQLLLLRPYVSSFSFRAVLNFNVKIALIAILKFGKGQNIGLLSTPCSRRLLFRRNQVYDQLILGDFKPEPFQTPNAEEFTKGREQVTTILVPGYISDRKNPFLVVEAGNWLSVNSDLDFRIIFFGQVDPTIASELKSHGHEWLSVVDKYSNLNEFLFAINNSSVILLPYSNRGSSGIVLQALYLRKTIILAKSSLWQPLSRLSGGQVVLTRLRMHNLVNSILAASKTSETHQMGFRPDLNRVTVFDFLLGRQSNGRG